MKFDIVNIPKWNDGYFQQLGILDHCHEVLTLSNHHRIVKVTDKTDAEVPAQIERELADLFIILAHRFQDNNPLINERIAKFKEKSGLK